AFGRSSGTDCETMILAVTMKMMSSTSVMSTSGVTLMPTIASSSCGAAPAISGGLLGRRLEQMRHEHPRQELGAREDRARVPLEGVVRRDRGDRYQEPDRRGDESLGDARHHGLRRERCGRRLRRGLPGRLAELVERLHDPDDRPEQADERRVVPERTEVGE